jgi:acyl CoA:acetate/3-ketoacid CoA transferase beta subunit
MHQRLTRKINVLRMYTEHAEFNYEQPKMTYNKKTGEVTIEEV